jgi:hypothetical protein
MTTDTYSKIGANFWLTSSNCSVDLNMTVAFYVPVEANYMFFKF